MKEALSGSALDDRCQFVVDVGDVVDDDDDVVVFVVVLSKKPYNKSLVKIGSVNKILLLLFLLLLLL